MMRTTPSDAIEKRGFKLFISRETINGIYCQIKKSLSPLNGNYAMQVSALEELSKRLHKLREQLSASSLAQDETLTEASPLVQAAKQCEFMLPEKLTVGSLTETVDRKIANVSLLLERARKHEALPEAVQIIAEHEYMVTDEDYAAAHEKQDSHETQQGRS